MDGAAPKEHLLAAVMAASPFGICVLDPPEPTVVLANPAMGRILGMPVLVGLPLRALVERIRPRRLDGSRIAFDDLPGMRALHGETVEGFEMMVEAGSGRTVWVTCSAAPALSPTTGLVEAAVDMFWDATRMKELERSRHALLGGIGHDLRTPLWVLRSHAQLLRREADAAGLSPAFTTSLDSMGRSVQRLDALVQDLTAFSLLEAHAVRLQLGEVVLPELVRSLVERLSAVLPDRSLRLRVDPAAAEPAITVRADPLRVEQILTNLLTNAARYSPEGQPIDIELGPAAGGVQVEVRVSDRGPGISEADKNDLFEPFRIGPQRHAESMGLGLYIARSLARAQGGEVMAEDRAGGGAVFTLRLPCHPAAKP
jgi:two-component system, NtrC family, sensor histidine kinase KinB